MERAVERVFTHWVRESTDVIGRAVVRGDQEGDPVKLAAIELNGRRGIFFLMLVDARKLEPISRGSDTEAIL